MPPKKAAEKSASSKSKIPPVLQIPKTMLTKKHLRKNHQQDCKLLAMPVEITINIIKSSGLDAFDIACLMLTCKDFASLITNFNVEPRLKTELKSGKEFDALSRYDYLSEPDFEDELEESAYHEKCKMQEEEFQWARGDGERGPILGTP